MYRKSVGTPRLVSCFMCNCVCAFSPLECCFSRVLTVSSADSDSQTASGCLSSWHCVEYVVPSSSSSPVTVYSTVIISWAQTEHNLQSLHFDKLCCAELCSGASRIFAENYAARGAKQENSCNEDGFVGSRNACCQSNLFLAQ